MTYRMLLITGITLLVLLCACEVYFRGRIYWFVRHIVWGWYDKHTEWHRFHNGDMDELKKAVDQLAGYQVLNGQHNKQVKDFVNLQMDINKGLLKKGLLSNEQYNDVKKRADGIKCT